MAVSVSALKFVKTRLPNGAIDYVAEVPEINNAHGETVTQIRLWYNFYEKSWVGMMTTKEGYQVNSSQYQYTRDDARDCIVEDYNSLMEKGYGCVHIGFMTDDIVEDYYQKVSLSM
jgi:hypothetical protein